MSYLRRRQIKLSINQHKAAKYHVTCPSVIIKRLVLLVMGNVGGKNGDSKEYLDGGSCPFPDSMAQSLPHSHSPSPRSYHSPLIFTPQGIQTTITWSYDGDQVAVEGSWDNWRTREFLQRSGKIFSIMKVFQPGVYHYRFIVDGQWRYAPDLPRECDVTGNVFNILDLQEYVPEVLDNISGSETPPSPESSYDNSFFSLEDFNQKMPELPPLLQQRLLDRRPEFLEKPLAAALNHLYIQKGHGAQSALALSSTQRFRTKYVTLVLYKSAK